MNSGTNTATANESPLASSGLSGRPVVPALAAVAVALLLATTACAPAVPAPLAGTSGGSSSAGTLGSSSPTPTSTSASSAVTPSPIVATSASVSPSSSATSAPATPAPSAGAWRTFTSADSKVSFDYPASWRVSDAAGGSGGIDVDVANEADVVVASLHVGPSGGLGGACQGDVPYTVLDSVEVDLPHQPAKGTVTPRFAFRALQEPNRVTASFGLTDTPAGHNGTTCMFYNVVTGPSEWPLFSFADAFQVRAGGSEDDPMHKGAKTFPSLDAARAYMKTPDYLNAKRMITSLKIHES
ncbi:hypothetical protein [Arthrobacter sp. ov118]|uniref:hypothetical protein n=1 Tax=Arthrobacter sp. ov118 TaxID=1761747 RepID=UPI000B87468C|nr:hypothetical protein [Arthrobacter sp. ov118]